MNTFDYSNRSQNKTQNLPLDVEGQVNLLITEAKKESNLYKMYVGWMSFV